LRKGANTAMNDKNPDDNRVNGQVVPFRIVFVYAVVGALWILLSDKLLALVVQDPATITTLSMYKGWAFIALTACLLYLLIRRDCGKLQDCADQIKTNEELLLKTVHDLQKTEESLRRSERRFRSLFDDTPAVMLLIDPDTAEIVDANAAAASFYGYTKEELTRMKITELSTLSEEQVFHNLDSAKTGPQQIERRYRLRDGTVRDVEVYRAPITIEDRVFLFSVIHDVTARKHAETSHRESENRLRAITDTATDAIILVDDRKRVVYWNQTAEKMFGYASKEVLGEEMDFIVPDRYLKEHNNGFRRFAATGEGPLIGKSYEVSAIRKGGGEFPIELSISGIRLKEKWHAVGIVRDITERRSLEDQLRQAQKMEALGTLSGGIAHDFNNILMTIMGFASIIQGKIDVNDPLANKVNSILAASDRAANLVKSLLAFSRQEAMTLTVVNLPEVVEEMRKMMGQLLREDIELTITAAEPVLPVLADPGQIGQLLLNLASNARDAMPHRGVVSISTAPVDLDKEFVKTHGYGVPGRYALLTFSDTGIGMTEETRQRIFEPFYTTKEVGRGTGLGLSTSYGIVKQHKGFINCYSEPGRGTTFRIYLPVAQGEVVPTTKTEPEAIGGSETILLAEDESLVRGLVSEILQEAGYNVIEAVDGEDAVAKVRAEGEKISLAILDAIMPKKNGLEAYEEIARLRPGIRVIFTSGYPAEVFRKGNHLERDFNFITKPASPNELLRKVRAVLDE
jgi:two-component system, cell cycle sensor histidine kinase and response regulator CckA